MKFLLFLIFILAIGGGIFYFVYKSDQQLTNLQRDNRLLRSQLYSIKEKYDSLNNTIKSCSIEFIDLDNNYAILNKNSSVYLTPDENSFVMQKLNMTMQVELLEKALCNNSTWYYVSLPIDSKINSKGWTKEDNLNNLSITRIESFIEKEES